MLFEGIAVPMRQQPLHNGHINLISALSAHAQEVRVFLNRCVDSCDNPFGLEVRIQWLRSAIAQQGFTNVWVANRDVDSANRHTEYLSEFETANVIVLTTNETDDMYRSEGFKTFNHHVPENALLLHGHIPPNIHSTGRIIRSRLRQGISCEELMPSWVEQEARTLLLGK